MNIINKAFAWGYYRICLPVYGVLIGNRKKKNAVRKKYHIEKRQHNVVIFGTPNHGNLGDYAIYAAEKKLFEKVLPQSNVFGINMTDFQHEIDFLKKLLSHKDLLILTGGGNLGNQYMDDEKIRRSVIENFPDNRIVMFPQTLYFTKDAEGEAELKKTVEIYNRHKDLWLVARDEQSYRSMSDVFTGKVTLLPDVVLTWGSLTPAEKSGALQVFRNDVEGVLGKEEKQLVRDALQAEYETVEETDTEIFVDTQLEVLEPQLYRKLEQINKAELIVTDRLHGMIFAALAQTPCVVMGNYNHKVKETYKWVKHLDYIRFINELSELPGAIKQLKEKKDCRFEATEVEEKYQAFLEEILPCRF